MSVSTTTRRTGLIARVINDNLNAWEDYAGNDINVDVAYGSTAGDSSNVNQGWWEYRGQAAMCVAGDGSKIVRVRIGDGTAADRTVYKQEITDPEDPAQWTSWTQLYTGTHYSISIEASGSSYVVYTAKTDGIYVDNVLTLEVEAVIAIKPVYDGVRLYFQTVDEDTDTYRVVKWWYTDITDVSPSIVEDCANYRWYRSDIAVSKLVSGDTDYYYRFRAMAHEKGARERYASQTLTVDGAHIETEPEEGNVYSSAYYLAGPSEQAGYKVYENLYITSLASSRWPGGAYFLFFNERHFDVNGNVLSNHKNPLFWCRSVGYPYYMTVPIPVGYSIWGFAGAVEWEGYIWAAGNGRVLRRPQMEEVIDISNYIPEGAYEIPRDNQKSTGQLVVANPGNVIGSQLNMTDADEAVFVDRRLELAIGQKGAEDADYTWKVDEAWRLGMIHKVRGDDYKDRLVMELGNFWQRMEAPYREVLYLPGHFTWEDWQPNSQNQTFNYSNDWDSFVSYNPDGADPSYVPRLKTSISADPGVPAGVDTITLFAGWRGENGFVQALFWEDGGIVFRYQDTENFFFVEASSGGNLLLRRYLGGSLVTLVSTPMPTTTPFWMTIDFAWKRIRVDIDFDTEIEHTLTDPAVLSGFVGFTSPEVSNFTLSDKNAALTTKTMLRTLLAHVDEHEAEFEIDEETAAAAQIDVQLGPQSDLDSPEKAFRQTIEAGNLQVVTLEVEE